MDQFKEKSAENNKGDINMEKCKGKTQKPYILQTSPILLF